jgi:hypothetical protein
MSTLERALNVAHRRQRQKEPNKRSLLQGFYTAEAGFGVLGAVVASWTLILTPTGRADGITEGMAKPSAGPAQNVVSGPTRQLQRRSRAVASKRHTTIFLFGLCRQLCVMRGRHLHVRS